MIPRTSAGDIEQMPLGVIDLLQIGIVSNGFDTLLQRDDFVVTRHNGHGAKPSAVDTQLSYAFPILDNRPSAVAIGYAHSEQSMAMGLPVSRYSLVMNTSLWRNTLQAIEFRHDRMYPASSTGGNAGDTPAAAATGKCDNAITTTFDYYF